MNINLMDAVEREPSSKEKQRMLRAGADDPTRTMIRWATDTFTTFGVTVDASALGVDTDEDIARSDEALFGSRSIVRGTSRVSPEDFWRAWDALLTQLSSRELSGNRAHEGVSRLLMQAPGMAHARWATRVLNKDLRCGISQKTVVKIWPGLIEPFAVSLAHPYDPVKHGALGRGFLEPKLDGMRVTWVDGVPYTRNGHVLTGLDHVRAALSDLDDWVYDGEMLDPNVTFEETSGSLRKHAGDKRTQVFHVFDVIDRDSWRTKNTMSTASRKGDLRAIFSKGWERQASAQAFPVRPIFGVEMENPNMDTLIKARDGFLANGLEGAMWKDADASYQFKRSDSVLKIKQFHTMDVRILDVVEGNGKIAGMLGAFVVEMPDNARFNVGSGFTVSERVELWGIRETLVGRCVEIKYQNKTAKGVARLPTFVRMRPDQDID